MRSIITVALAFFAHSIYAQDSWSIDEYMVSTGFPEQRMYLYIAFNPNVNCTPSMMVAGNDDIRFIGLVVDSDVFTPTRATHIGDKMLAIGIDEDVVTAMASGRSAVLSTDQGITLNIDLEGLGAALRSARAFCTSHAS